MSGWDLLQMWQGAAHGERLPQGFCNLLSLTGHRKAECPQLIQGSAQGSTPAALRATDSRPVKVEIPRARGRAFKLTAEKVHAAPDVVAGTYLLIYVILRFVVLMLCCI